MAVKDKHVNLEDLKVVSDVVKNKANIDGSYENLTAGNAEQLVSTVFVEDSTPYKYRTSGGTADIGDREYDEIVGGTVAWNQLQGDAAVSSATVGEITYSYSHGKLTISGTCQGGDSYWGQNGADPINFIKDHKYYVTFGNPDYVGSSQTGRFYTAVTYKNFDKNNEIYNAPQTYIARLNVAIIDGATWDITVIPQVFDLTQMFGSTIADYIYSLEQANEGAGVAWFRKLFPNPYYAYNAGELISVAGLQSHDMTGFNQWDEEWEVGAYDTTTGAKTVNASIMRCKNFIPVLPSTTYFINASANTLAYLKPLFYDSGYSYIGTVNSLRNAALSTPANACYMTFYMNTNYGTTYKNDICINLSWDGERDGEYEPYVKNSYPLDDSLTLRGIPKLDSNNELYYDGDTYESDGTVTRKYGVVTLNGSETWYKEGADVNSYKRYYISMNDLKRLTNYRNTFINNRGITTLADYQTSQDVGDFAITAYSNVPLYPNQNWLYIFSKNIETRDAFKEWLQSNPITIVYELATPTTETADPYQTPQIVDDFGTEEYVSNTIVPVGHNTKYTNNLRAKLEMAPDSPDGDGDYIVRQTSGQNSYVLLLFPASDIPAAPTEDGNYTLKCTVASGTATYTWEAQS